jgi:hypothetical protein
MDLNKREYRGLLFLWSPLPAALTLEDTQIRYKRIVDRIYQNPIKAEREDSTRILSWIVCAKRPLKWHEIQGLLSIKLEDRTVDFEEQRLRVDMKDLCGSLVEIHRGNTIELVHLSAKL